MALPVSFDTDLSVGPQNSYHGPFKGSNGAFYTVLQNTVAGVGAAFISLHKATDPTDSFSEVDTEQIGGSSGDTKDSIWCVQSADIISIVMQENVGSSNAVYYSSANLSNDTISAEVLIESLNTDDDGPDAHACSIAVEPVGGDIVVVYQGDPDMVMGTEYARIDANKSTDGGTNWSGTGFPLAIDNAGSDHWTGPVIVAGSSDRMHIFFKNDDVDDVFQRTLLSNDNLETFPSAIDTGVDAGNLYGWGRAVLSGTNVYAAYMDSDGTSSYVKFTSADAPGNPTPITGLSDNDVDAANLSVLHGFALDGLDVHYFYSAAGINDLLRDIDTGSGFGTDTTVLALTDVRHVSSNIYDRSGTKLAYIYDDAGVVKYNEVDISTAYATLSAVKFPDQNYFVGPFDI